MKPSRKIFIVISGMLLLGAGIALSAQSNGPSNDNIAPAFKKGDASAIAKHFDGNVIITNKAGSSSYSKSQAEILLKNFFSAHAAKGFTIVHQGTSPEGSRYLIGALTTSTGNYKVYVSSKVNNNNLVIQEIRFEDQP